MVRDRRIKRKCKMCDEWCVPGSGQKFCAAHKMSGDGDSNSPLNQKARRYGLPASVLAEMEQEQGGRCAICGVVQKLMVDHDHACCPGKESCGRCVRGLICSNCNRALGLMADDPERLNSAAEYLRSKW